MSALIVCLAGFAEFSKQAADTVVVQVDPVLTPVLPVRDELEVAATQRMERVRHPHQTVSII